MSMKTGKSELYAKVTVPVDPSPYMVEQAFFPSKDGTRVSMFLVHRKGLVRDGNNPTLLYGYGGFNINLTPGFAAAKAAAWARFSTSQTRRCSVDGRPKT